MFNYELWRYKQGLSGEKPSAFVPDSPARQAKEAGYKQYLANKDLAERVSETSEVTESCYPWESNDPEPDWLVRSGREMEAIHNRYLDEIAARRPLSPCEKELQTILDELKTRAALESETPFMTWLRALSIKKTMDIAE